MAICEEHSDGHTMKTALVCIDFINDVIADGGKLAAKGYSSFAGRHKTFDHLKDLQTSARGQGMPVIHVGLGFDVGYLGFPETSPLLGGAMAAHALALGSWGTEFVAGVGPVDHDIALRKPRISALPGTATAVDPDRVTHRTVHPGRGGHRYNRVVDGLQRARPRLSSGSGFRCVRRCE